MLRPRRRRPPLIVLFLFPLSGLLLGVVVFSDSRVYVPKGLNAFVLCRGLPMKGSLLVYVNNGLALFTARKLFTGDALKDSPGFSGSVGADICN